ncbi:hypothetical protein KKE92_01745 [Candidatus Micrarchaeota archaeon]|nr:hypothetical protein [Candidatus Micrarchaeota archaeon]MBU1682137.1 hypothetical protein [Candidatus Micrarchaeota archaeon]
MVRQLKSQRGETKNISKKLRIFATASATLIVAGLMYSMCDRPREPEITVRPPIVHQIAEPENNEAESNIRVKVMVRSAEKTRPLLKRLSRDFPDDSEITCEKIARPADYSVKGYQDYFNPVSSKGLQNPENNVPESHSPDYRLLDLMESSSIEEVMRALEMLADAGVMIENSEGFSPLVLQYLRSTIGNSHESYDAECLRLLGEATLAMARGMMRIADEILDGNIDAALIMERLPLSMIDIMLTHMQSRIFANENFSGEETIAALENLDPEIREAILSADISELDSRSSDVLLSNVSETIDYTEQDDPMRDSLGRLHRRTMDDAMSRYNQILQDASIMSRSSIDAIWNK